MATIFGLLAVLAGVGSFVCWIMEVITAFKKEESPLLGILSIVLTIFCGIGGFVIGWMKSGEWGIQKLMMIWTALIVAGIVLNVIAGAMGAAGGMPVPQPAGGF